MILQHLEVIGQTKVITADALILNLHSLANVVTIFWLPKYGLFLLLATSQHS